MGNSKRGNRLPPFVPLTWDMLNHDAYKDLTPSGAKALPYFLGKVKLTINDPQRYLTDFTFSYPEAEKLGFAPSTFSGVIKALIKFGFIDPVSKGGLRGNGKGYNVFRLSRRWELHGESKFKPVVWKGFLKR